MKALTIKQPWASLIVNNYKMYEFRSWKTNYRGKILIHAGSNVEKEYMDRFNPYNLEYNKSAIIGEVTITDCILVDDNFSQYLSSINSIVYNHNYKGLYAWKLENIIKYDKPIYAKGKLSLWEYN